MTAAPTARTGKRVGELRVGLLFGGTDLTIAEMAGVARQAELSGLDGLYCVEAYRCGLLPVAALAQATERVAIGPYVLNASFRTPFAAALAAVDLAEMSGGRFVLAVGSGNAHVARHWVGVDPDPPLAKMRDYVTILRQMLRARQGERVSYRGTVHGIDWVRQSPEGASRSVPVHLAASFPKMIATAATSADGVALGALLSATHIHEVLHPSVHAAAERAGRDPRDLTLRTCVMMAVDDDRTRAAQLARQAVAGVFAAHPHPYYEHLLREQGFGGQLTACLDALAKDRFDTAVDAIDDELIDALIVWGTPPECVMKLRAYEGVVDEVVIANVASPSGVVDDDALHYRPVLDVVERMRQVSRR